MKLSKMAKSRATFWVAHSLTLIGVVAFVVLLVNKVSGGDGTQQYLSMAGIQVSYIGALALFGVIPLFVIVLYVLDYFGNRDYRDFQKKYKIDDENVD